MKKLHILIATFFIVFLSACSKDELDTNATKIVGTWRMDHTEYILNGEIENEVDEDETTITFHSNGEYETSMYETFMQDNKEVRKLMRSYGTYKISSNGKTLTTKDDEDDEDDADIVELTNTTLVLRSKRGSQDIVEAHLKKIK